ncbi:hypothetical protein [Blastococcus xanthinilyticus]|uniref:Uncharacterized protein n=1 Tax=Blastococcus xanthinilyticus TaxID=1564164 RepID=A0A5S5D6Y2_9ACTN|nr:hypothetical protein [Blastococcus xanthinilyticus]TYP90806.1 hypothetical protein BD833_101525 [Blastococcus xanthinilyticus]
MSTGNLLADCERWCRDTLPRRPVRTALRVVPAPVEVPRPAPLRRGTFRPGADWPGLAALRTGS